MCVTGEDMLRFLLWIHHGCSQVCLYGDDGEMQCNNELHGVPIDFKRDTVNQLEWKLANDTYKSLFPYPED